MAHDRAEEHTWQVTFPGNLRWTNATQIVKGMVPYGASNMAEIDNIRRRLNSARRARPISTRPGRRNGRARPTASPPIGDKADAEGFKITAGNQYMRAGNYYYSAERFIPPGEEKLGDVSQGAALLPGRDDAAASRHRARRGAV